MTAWPANAARALERWWFAPSERYQVGVFRVLLVAWVGWFYAQRLFAKLDVASGRPPELFDPPSLGLDLPLPLLESLRTPVQVAASIVVVLALLGVFTRVSLVLLAVLNLYLGLWANSWGYTAHASALPALVLVILAVAPGATCFSLDAIVAQWCCRRQLRRRPPSALEVWPRRARSVWPVRGVLLLLCMVYFTAGLSKLRYSGPEWADGRTLGFYLGGGSLRGDETQQRFIGDPRPSEAVRFRDGYGIVDHAYVGRPSALGVWFSGQPLLLRILAGLSMLWELLFPLALLGDRPRNVLLWLGASFHFGIGVMLRINFVSYLVCYTLFIDWNALWARWLRLRRSRRAAAAVASSLPRLGQ